MKNLMKMMSPQLREPWEIARLFEKWEIYEKLPMIDFCVGYLFKVLRYLNCSI